MDSFLSADIFFFISAIGFLTLFLLFGILLWRLLRLVRKIERVADVLSERAGMIIDDVRESTLYRLLIGASRRKKREQKKPARTER